MLSICIILNRRQFTLVYKSQSFLAENLDSALFWVAHLVYKGNEALFMHVLLPAGWLVVDHWVILFVLWDVARKMQVATHLSAYTMVPWDRRHLGVGMFGGDF